MKLKVFLLTMFDGRTNLSIQVADEVKNSLAIKYIRLLFHVMYVLAKLKLW